MSERKLICVILAAGKGTRMKSSLPKVLHKVAGEPMLTHVIRAAKTLTPDQIIVVVGPGMDNVAAVAAPHDVVIQTEQLGTGHAVRTALAGQATHGADVMVLCGDVPLVAPESLSDLLAEHRDQDADVTILAMQPDNPTGYGRLITNADGHVSAIIEELDADAPTKKINLCNSAMMVLRGEGLEGLLNSIQNKNAKGEYYLTDVLALSRAKGGLCAYTVGDAQDLNGVNDRVQLSIVERRFQERARVRAMQNGVTLIDPDTVYFSADTVLGRDVTVEPHVFFGLGVRVADDVQIRANCYIENVIIKDKAIIGPFARIREHSLIGESALIGNFVEVKKSVVGRETKASHLTYLCDLDVGEFVNVGVGANFSNWDGIRKTRTNIGDRSFIGANATVVSPVTIGADSYIAAGSVITDDVPADKLAFGRARQSVRDHTDKTRAFSTKKKKG